MPLSPIKIQAPMTSVLTWLAIPEIILATPTYDNTWHTATIATLVNNGANVALIRCYLEMSTTSTTLTRLDCYLRPTGSGLAVGQGTNVTHCLGQSAGGMGGATIYDSGEDDALQFLTGSQFDYQIPVSSGTAASTLAQFTLLAWGL